MERQLVKELRRQPVTKIINYCYVSDDNFYELTDWDTDDLRHDNVHSNSNRAD